MKKLEERMGDKVLQAMGLSTQELALLFVSLLMILLLLFVFIFLGIGAFTAGNTFQSVVNSVIAISAGGAVGQNRGKSKSERQFQLKETLDKVIERLKKAL